MARSPHKRQESALEPSGQALGFLLGERRRARRLTQAQLARRLGMSSANVSRIEHGADFRVSTLLDLARELRLEPVLVPKDQVPAVRAVIGPSRSEGGDAPPERGRFA